MPSEASLWIIRTSCVRDVPNGRATLTQVAMVVLQRLARFKSMLVARIQRLQTQ